MFTGVVTHIGLVKSATGGKLSIHAPGMTEVPKIGASIACDGCCLTVTRTAPEKDGVVFDVDVSNETLSRTTLGGWRAGRRVNLERSLRAQDELGGHLVMGHVDDVAKIVGREADGQSSRFTLQPPAALLKLIAPKGSVTLDGVSLTVNEVAGDRFSVNLIPHSLEVTNWGEKQIGDGVNLEVDVLARYVARISEFAAK